MAQITLNSTGIASSGALVLQSNGTTTAVTVSTGQVATFANDAVVNGLTVGRGAGAVSTNTAVGASALPNNTTGNQGVFVGSGAGTSNTTGINNIGVGFCALYSGTTTGSQNVGVGSYALYGVTTGANNSGFGQETLQSNTTGSANVAVGTNALNANTTASNNTALGYQAGYSITTGGGNTFVGKEAGYSVTSGTNNVMFGSYTGNSQGGLDVRFASNYIVFSNGASNGDWFAYVNGASTGNSWFQRSNSSSWATTSDARVKKNVIPVENGLSIITALKPVEFDYILTDQHDIGFIAQEYEKVLPNQVIEQDNSSDEYTALTNGERVKGIQQNLVPYLVKAIQELKAEFDAYKSTHP